MWSRARIFHATNHNLSCYVKVFTKMEAPIPLACSLRWILTTCGISVVIAELSLCKQNLTIKVQVSRLRSTGVLLLLFRQLASFTNISTRKSNHLCFFICLYIEQVLICISFAQYLIKHRNDHILFALSINFYVSVDQNCSNWIKKNYLHELE